MSWSYSYAPSTNARDAVRLLVEDTDGGDPLLMDQEIDFFLAEQGGARRAAVAACEAIVAKLARRVDLSVDGVSKKLSDQHKHYAETLLPLLRRRAQRGSADAYAGGISASDKELREADDDRARPAFARESFAVVGRGAANDRADNGG